MLNFVLIIVILTLLFVIYAMRERYSHLSDKYNAEVLDREFIKKRYLQVMALLAAVPVPAKTPPPPPPKNTPTPPVGGTKGNVLKFKRKGK